MSAHVQELLWDLLHGALASDEQTAVEAHLAGCEPCQRSHLQLLEATTALGWTQPPVSVPAGGRARLLAEIAAVPARFAAVLERFAALFDLPRERAATLLASLGRRSTWQDSPIPGLRVFHAAAGPACAGAYTGFVQMVGGLHFPSHRHVGDETMLVLEGGFRERDGRLFHAGSEPLVKPAGSSHDFVVLADGPCIATVIQHGGVEFGEP